MSGLLNIKQGGKIRYNLPIPLGQTWSRGQALIINSASSLELLSAGNNVALRMVGLALENCVSAATGNVMQDTSTVLAGRTGGILLGEAIVETDNLSGTGSWLPGVSTVYALNGGNFSYSGTSGLAVGKAISNPVSDGKLTFLYQPAMGG